MPNKLLSTEKLQEALELIAKGITRPTRISKAIGVAYRTYLTWMVESNRGDPKYLVTYNDEQMQFAKAITLSTKLALYELRGMLLQEGIYGYDEVQTKDGQIVWALDPEACAEPDLDIREMLYGRRDGLLVVGGKLVPVTVKKKAPFAQQIRLLEAAFPDLRPSSTVTQNVNLAGAVGIGFAKPTDYTRGPPAIPPAPAVPSLPAPTDAEFSEIEEPDDFSDLLGPEPAPVAPINVIFNVDPPDQEPVEVEVEQPGPPTVTPIRDLAARGEISHIPEPVAPINEVEVLQEQAVRTAFDEPPRRPARTPLEQSLYDALEAAKVRKAQP